MPTNDAEYQKEYMRFYRKMMKEAKRLRSKRKDLVELPSECLEFREQVVQWLEGKLQKTLKISIEWNNHMCSCKHGCAEWFVKVRHAGFKRGVNLFPKKD